MPLFSESTTVIAVALAAGAATILLVLLVILAFLLVRGRRSTRELTEHVLSQSSVAFEARVADLEGALEQAREETQRSRQLASVRESLDLDQVLSRALDVAASLPGVNAAMIVLMGSPSAGDAKPLIASVGLSPEESASSPAVTPLDGSGAQAVAISYRYQEERRGDPSLIRGGVAVPLAGEDDEPVGTLAVFWRTERDADQEDYERVEYLARGVGLALENARRFKEARQLADLDALTNLHNRRFFHETLTREVTRAQRYDRRLALVLLDLDEFKAINDRVGHLAGDSLLAEIGERIQSVVRGVDVACRIGGDEFAVILPESVRADAEQLYRRLEVAVASRPLRSADRLHLSAGIAELQPDDLATTLFERADAALYRAKERGKGRSITAEQPR